MNMLRFVDCVLLSGVTLLLGGCTLHIDFDGSVTINDGKGSVLPSPKAPSGQEPMPAGQAPGLDEAQQARQAEFENYLLSVMYHGGTITEAFQLPSGDVVDFIARDTLPVLPYALPSLPFTPDDVVLPAGVQLGLSELEQIPELLELAATATPFNRPRAWPYILGETDATSIEDYFDRYQLGGAPSSSEHLYAGIRSQVPNRGVSGFMKQTRPDVEPKSFSLMEFAVACPAFGPVQEMIGVVISVDKVNPFAENNQALTDGEPRLHIEYARLDSNGQIKYKWDQSDGSFRPNPFRRRYHPGQKVPVSALDGTQVEHLVAMFQAPVTGDWWISYKEELLGYYPTSLFKLLNTGACRSQHYIEVARWKPDTPTAWPKTEAGNGQFPEIAGLFNTAYVRNPKYYDGNWFGIDAPDNAIPAPEYNEKCYKSVLVPRGANRLVLFGGSGGKDAGCKGVVPP